MKPSKRFGLILRMVILLLCIWGLWNIISRRSSRTGSVRVGNDTIDYHGEHFKMRKAYWSYEDYKDDPNNLDTNELERIEKVMTETKLPSTFATQKEFTHALFDLKFPGYGVGGIGDKSQTDDGSELIVETVEIPQRDKDRYFVVRQSAGHLVLLDDFVFSTASNLIKHVQLKGMKLLYYDGKGEVVREKEVVTDTESQRLNPLMAIDNERELRKQKRQVTVFRGIESESVYVRTTNAVPAAESKSK